MDNPDDAPLERLRAFVLGHTEVKALAKSRLQPGEEMTLTGERAPCPSCKLLLLQEASATRATIRYQWRDGGRTMRWTTE